MENNNIRTMEYTGIIDFGNPVYKCIETGILFKDLNDRSYKNDIPELYSCGNEIDGDPCYPINKNITIIYNSKYIESPNKIDYMILSRLQGDCEYYLNYGNRYKGHLYYKDEQKHIIEMKVLWNDFPHDKKPEWLTYDQILNYEKLMINDNI